MSNKISRRTFLKCTGASAAALGAAAMLGGCGSSTSDAIEVKVGDKVSNWNNLGVQLTSVFTMSPRPARPRVRRRPHHCGQPLRRDHLQHRRTEPRRAGCGLPSGQ